MTIAESLKYLLIGAAVGVLLLSGWIRLKNSMWYIKIYVRWSDWRHRL